MSSLADDSLISDFVAESRDHLNAIEPDLLTMEQQGAGTAQDVINKVFRAIHSIKGGAGFFAFEALKSLSHVMESVLTQVRDRTVAVTPELMDTLFAGLDRMRAMLDDIRASDGVPIAGDLARLEALLQGTGTRVGAQVDTSSPGTRRQFKLDAEAARSAIRRGMRFYHANALLHRDVDARWGTPLAFLKSALSVGQCLDAFLDISSVGGLGGEEDQDVSASVLFATVLEPDLLPTALKLPAAQIIPLDMEALKASLGPETRDPAQAQAAPPEPPADDAGRAEPASVPAPAQDPSGAPGRKGKDAGPETLRVRVELLTTLMNLAGELVLGRNQLLRTMGPHAQGFPGLGGILQNINQVTTELQEAAMQTRMQPIGALFDRFPRIIRDMARSLGKQIEVKVRGAEVELDKSILELLADPLTHIIRNCADHAIEPPEERRASGKPAAGTIQLEAFHEGGQVHITVRDDGRGIDARKVAGKAIRKGIITQAQGEAMSERDLVGLVFAPGFSTADQVSDISGRGVGMDVVRTNTEKLGGKVDIETRVGQGTLVRLQLPLTLAIIPSMIVATEGQRFAIPQVDVVELVWVRAEEVCLRIEQVQGAEVLRLRDKLLPLVRLSQVLRIQRTFEARGERVPDRRRRIADRRGAPAPGSAPARGGERRRSWQSDYSIVVLQMGGHQFGVIVDQLHDFEEIVVKPISAHLGEETCFSGATILGDGGVIMILDPARIALKADLRFLDLQAEEQRRQEQERQRKALLDSRRRSVILFEAGEGERFAVAQDRVLRLEQIRGASIERIREREYLAYRGESIPLVRLDQHLKVSPLRADADELYLVIPHPGGQDGKPRAGILISAILDALDVDSELQPVEIPGPGLLGSAMVQGRMTLFLDPAELVRAAQAGGNP